MMIVTRAFSAVGGALFAEETKISQSNGSSFRARSLNREAMKDCELIQGFLDFFKMTFADEEDRACAADVLHKIVGVGNWGQFGKFMTLSLPIKFLLL